MRIEGEINKYAGGPYWPQVRSNSYRIIASITIFIWEICSSIITSAFLKKTSPFHQYNIIKQRSYLKHTFSFEDRHPISSLLCLGCSS